MRRVAVAGVYMTDVGLFEDRKPFDMGVEAVAGAIADSGFDKGDIKALVNTPVGYLLDKNWFVVQRMAEYLEMRVRVMCEVDCGGASSLLALRHVASEIALGRIDAGVVYAVHLEKSTGSMIRQHEDNSHIVRAANSIYGSYDSRFGVLSPIHYYAMCTQRYMSEYGISEESIAALPVVLRENAAKNPRAMYRDPITVEDVLSSRMLCPPVHLLESCPMSHGAAAAVLAAEEAVSRHGRKPVLITGYGEAHDDSHFMPHSGRMDRFPAVLRSSEEAYSEAGTGPGGIDVAEVYGVFAGTELMTYEELGFFKRGEAPGAVEAGRTRPGGDIAVNTSGGRLSLGHAAFATPLFEVFEVVTQLRGEAGERQVPGARRGLVHAEHGMINGSVVMILEVP